MRSRASEPSASRGQLATVVIPTYNHGQWVSGAIESVLAQDYEPIEIIVVDDGSSDGTRQVVERFGEAVRYVWQENRGLSAARNTGIQLAAGEYIGVLDADDFYESNFMSVLVSRLNARPDAEAIYCGYRFVDAQNRPLPQVESRDVAPAALFQTLAEGNFLVPEAILVRRRCYAAVGPFDESLRAIEDMDMWLRISRDHTVIGCSEILTRHRVLPVSMSTDPERQCVNRLKVITKLFGAVPDDPATMPEASRRAHARARLTATVEHLQCSREARARELFVEMVRICPTLLLELDTFYGTEPGTVCRPDKIFSRHCRPLAKKQQYRRKAK